MNPKTKPKMRRPGVPSNPPKVVGQARNEFGTRLCRRVECERCKKADHVPARILGDRKGYCRTCAEHILRAFDQGRQIPEKKVGRSCAQCTRFFEVSEKIGDKKDELLCIDCYRGFEVWRGKAIPDRDSSEFSYSFGPAGSKTIIRKVDR